MCDEVIKIYSMGFQNEHENKKAHTTICEHDKFAISQIVTDFIF